MTYTTALRPDDARGSLIRASAEAANAALAYSLNYVLTAGGATTATTTSAVKTVNTITYLINGVFKSEAPTDPEWTLAGTTVAISSFQKYALLLDAAGTPTIQEATQSVVSAAAVSWTNVNNYGPWGPALAIFNAGKCVAAMLTIATDATHTFIPGTTLLGAAGITATLVDGIDQSLMPLIGNMQGTIIGNF